MAALPSEGQAANHVSVKRQMQALTVSETVMDPSAVGSKQMDGRADTASRWTAAVSGG